SAILIALSIAVLIYLAVGVSILVGIGPAGVAATPAPLAAAVQASGWAWASLVVRLGAAAAALGALLALIAGIGRTTLAMARHDDLPRWLAAVHERHQVPHHAGVAVAALVCVLCVAVLPDRQPGRLYPRLRAAPISAHPANHRGARLRHLGADVAVARRDHRSIGLRPWDLLSSHSDVDQREEPRPYRRAVARCSGRRISSG